MADEIAPPSPELTHAYRAGFMEGVRRVVRLVADSLPEEQARALETWADGPVRDWSMGDDASPPPVEPLISGA